MKMMTINRLMKGFNVESAKTAIKDSEHNKVIIKILYESLDHFQCFGQNLHFSTLTPPETLLLSVPKKIRHSRFQDGIVWRKRQKNSVFVHEYFEKWQIRLLIKTNLKNIEKILLKLCQGLSDSITSNDSQLHLIRVIVI